MSWCLKVRGHGSPFPPADARHMVLNAQCITVQGHATPCPAVQLGPFEELAQLFYLLHGQMGQSGMQSPLLGNWTCTSFYRPALP